MRLLLKVRWATRRPPTQRASKTLLLVPGQHLLGEGVLLEIHGFIVDLLAPVAGAEVRAGQPLPVRVKVTMT